MKETQQETPAGRTNYKKPMNFKGEKEENFLKMQRRLCVKTEEAEEKP